MSQLEVSLRQQCTFCTTTSYAVIRFTVNAWDPWRRRTHFLFSIRLFVSLS